MAPDLPTPGKHTLYEDIFAILIGTTLVSLGIVLYSNVLLVALNHKPGRYVGFS